MYSRFSICINVCLSVDFLYFYVCLVYASAGLQCVWSTFCILVCLSVSLWLYRFVLGLGFSVDFPVAGVLCLLCGCCLLLWSMFVASLVVCQWLWQCLYLLCLGQGLVLSQSPISSSSFLSLSAEIFSFLLRDYHHRRNLALH